MFKTFHFSNTLTDRTIISLGQAVINWNAEYEINKYILVHWTQTALQWTIYNQCYRT